MAAIEAHKKGTAFNSLMARGGELFGECDGLERKYCPSEISILPRRSAKNASIGIIEEF